MLFELADGATRHHRPGVGCAGRRKSQAIFSQPEPTFVDCAAAAREFKARPKDTRLVGRFQIQQRHEDLVAKHRRRVPCFGLLYEKPGAVVGSAGVVDQHIGDIFRKTKSVMIEPAFEDAFSHDGVVCFAGGMVNYRYRLKILSLKSWSGFFVFCDDNRGGWLLQGGIVEVSGNGL